VEGFMMPQARWSRLPYAPRIALMTGRSNTAAQAERATSKSNSYGEIFKASALIGFSTLASSRSE
jgi:hypothetical protein